ncbi:MAG: transposase [Flavobacteriales bacterium]
MTEKFKNKYRIKSIRLPHWDYRNNGMYFITICTKNRLYFFGNVKNGHVHLNEIGKLAYQYWNEIPEHFSFVKLGEFVVMPNHVHGILIVDKDGVSNVESLHCNDSTLEMVNDTLKNQHMSKISPKPGSISTIIRSYKSVVTKNARKIHVEFEWQSRFYDHIIRNERSFKNISNYIVNNPKNWKEDRFT